MKVIYASGGGGWIHRSAAELLQLGHEALVYSPARNSTNLPAASYRRCWPFHLACQPFFRMGAGIGESALLALFPIWKIWLQRQTFPRCDAVHAVMAYATEAFDHAERIGALKVLDASNSHPTSFHGFWQREIDIWSPGRKVNLPRWIFTRANREIERADVVLCASTYVRDTMLYNGVPESKLAVNPFGVDLETFVAREQVPAKPRFLFVGSLTLRKGLQYLIPAFERLRAEFPDAELILCGTVYSPDFDRLFEKWRHLFTHHRGLPHAELSSLMRSCTAFVFPSIEEGFARVIAEAMASGLPIIATHNSGATTVVEDGKEGIIVPTGSPDAVYQAMQQMIQRPDLCERMGKAAAARMARGGSWADYARRLVEVYARHIRHSPAGSLQTA